MGKITAMLVLSGGLCIAAPAGLQFSVGAPHRSQRPQLLQNSHHGLFEIATSSTVQVSYPVAPGADRIGSGVWVSKEGYVATCWHVIKDATGQVTVNVSVAAYEKNLIVTGSFYTLVAHVVAYDEPADVAVLKVDNNPFTNPPGTFIKRADEQIKARFAVPQFRQQLPDPGDQIVLSGFPLGRPDLISQVGVVAGIGIPGQIGNQADLAKLVRVLASVVSNPANSGGPVFDSSGQLIGILEGNLPSPMRDEQGRDVLYFRPKRDSNGSLIPDQSGNVQNEIAALSQNSGISVVVPVEFVTSTLRQAVAIVASSTPERLQRMAPRPTPYSMLSNQELKTATLSLVSEIRQFLGDKRLAENQLSDAEMTAVAQAKSDAERHALWSSHNAQLLQFYESKLSEFNLKYKMRAVWSHNELLLRLPVTKPDPRVHYERIINDFDIERIADDLKHLVGELH